MTLDEINKVLGPDGSKDLQLIIADIKAAIAASGDGLIADKQKELDAAISSNADITADRDKCQKLADERYAFILKAEDALTNGASLDDVKTILDPLIVKEKTPEQEKENAEIDRVEQELRDELAARIAELEAKRAEINKK